MGKYLIQERTPVTCNWCKVEGVIACRADEFESCSNFQNRTKEEHDCKKCSKNIGEWTPERGYKYRCQICKTEFWDR